MKFIIKIIPIFILISISTQGYAQSNNKRLLIDKAFQKLPIYFPLAKKGFKRLSSPFGMRKHPILKTRKFHTGVDLAAKQGTPIYASANGKIISVQYSKGYGNYVIIDHLFGYKTMYGHMLTAVVKKNQKVKQGTIIGYVGSTGRSTGPHLHYEILKANKKIDPLGYWVTTLGRRKKLLKS